MIVFYHLPPNSLYIPPFLPPFPLQRNSAPVLCSIKKELSYQGEHPVIQQRITAAEARMGAVGCIKKVRGGKPKQGKVTLHRKERDGGTGKIRQKGQGRVGYCNIGLRKGRGA